MPMDAAVFAALALELERELREARLEKIIPVNPRELSFVLRLAASGGRRDERALVVSLDGPLARLHLEASTPGDAARPVWPNSPRRPAGEPPAALPFVLLLRRHLTGCRLTAVHHPAWERILHLTFLGPADEFPRRRLTLVYELLGTQGNLLLLDAQDVLLGALRPLPPPERGARMILGARYAPPPPPPAVPGAPLSYLQQAVTLAAPATPLRSALVRNVGGLSPWAARALAGAAGLDPEAPCRTLSPEDVARLHTQLETFAGAVTEGRFSPVLWREAGQPREFWVYPAPCPAGWSAEPQPSANEAVTRFFTERVAAARFAQARQALLQRLDAQLARLERRLKAQREDLARAEAADDLRRAGELILANLPRLSRGMTSFTGSGYADPLPRTVALDPRLTPPENAQRYFDRYRKAKRGQEEAAARVAATAGLLSQVRLARLEAQDAETLADVQALAHELVEEGVLEESRPRSQRGRAPSHPAAPVPAKPNPRRYRSSDGHDILVGRNSRENDWLTLRTGAPHDLWLHVKDLAGAHVILRLPAEEPVPEEALREAAQIAAYHSEGRESSQVPVDYTLRRHVRKTPGGRPGQVLYDHHRTLYVTPDPALVARLRADGGHPQ
ncbi:MAG: NFACT family protein [Bacillota bacterium]|nr:NFACT family protein [Bacillota bacterium]